MIQITLMAKGKGAKPGFSRVHYENAVIDRASLRGAFDWGEIKENFADGDILVKCFFFADHVDVRLATQSTRAQLNGVDLLFLHGLPIAPHDKRTYTLEIWGNDRSFRLVLQVKEV